MPPHKTVDYSKWNDLDDSDDDDKPKADHVAEYTAATIAKRKQEEEEKRRQDAEKAGLDAAITAAAMASSMGNAEALDEMMAQTQAAAPLAPEMEKIIRSLPAAAQIAARASAATMASGTSIRSTTSFGCASTHTLRGSRTASTRSCARCIRSNSYDSARRRRATRAAANSRWRSSSSSM